MKRSSRIVIGLIVLIFLGYVSIRIAIVHPSPSMGVVIDDIRLAPHIQMQCDLPPAFYLVHLLVEMSPDFDPKDYIEVTSINYTISDSTSSKNRVLENELPNEGRIIWKHKEISDRSDQDDTWYRFPHHVGLAQSDTKVYLREIGSFSTTGKNRQVKIDITAINVRNLPDQLCRWEVRVDPYKGK